MANQALFDRALGLLIQLCERYEEMSASAHVAVMEAFNRFADATPNQLIVEPPLSELSVRELLSLTLESIDELSRAASELRLRLMYVETRHLIQLAASES